MSDSFIQVQPDSIGKLVDLDLVQTTAGTSIYSQRARFVGNTQDALDQIYWLSVQQLTLLRMINSTLQTSASTQATESDFLDPSLSFEDDFISTAQDIG